MKPSTAPSSAQLARLQAALDQADAILIGAGAGLSTSAGFTYAGDRFTRYFADFARRYGFQDMYTGGFHPYAPEEYWAYWSRYIWINRYMPAPRPVYDALRALTRDRDVFVLTTNVDHCFQRAGFDRQRLFYTQGDYGLLQCSVPCHANTYDNEALIRRMVEAQGFSIAPDGTLSLPKGAAPKMTVPADLIPRCPRCCQPMTMNLRSDDTFVEDEGWHRATRRYDAFLRSHEGAKLLLLELGVGWNTPSIIKIPFWRLTAQNPQTTYVCVNPRDAVCPPEIQHRSILLHRDIGDVLFSLRPAFSQAAT